MTDKPDEPPAEQPAEQPHASDDPVGWATPGPYEPPAWSPPTWAPDGSAPPPPPPPPAAPEPTAPLPPGAGPYGPPPSQSPADPPPPPPIQGQVVEPGPMYGGVPYPQPGQHGYAGYAAPTTAPKATWALVIGIISVVLVCCSVFGLIGIAAIVLGVQARREIAAGNGVLTGDGTALAGIILGAIGSVLGGVFGLVQIAMFAADGSLSIVG